MDFGFGTYTLGFFAGAASILSPCVLPLLPILIASALTRHRFGPVALALGLGASFAAVGILFATLGAAADLDPALFRSIAAALMVLFGLLMMFSQLHMKFIALSARLSAVLHGILGRVSGAGLSGQLAIGLLLGVVWSPCVGPTLGAAATLAAQGRQLGGIALLMGVFALGAALPLMVLGACSRATFGRARGALALTGRTARPALGSLFMLLGILALSGWDHRLETALLGLSPDWLTRLSTSL